MNYELFTELFSMYNRLRCPFNTMFCKQQTNIAVTNDTTQLLKHYCYNLKPILPFFIPTCIFLT
jgi:hypothetical protein